MYTYTIIGIFEMNPGFSRLEFYIRYILSLRTVIDLVCILPFYITSTISSSSQSTTSFVRVSLISCCFIHYTLSYTLLNMLCYASNYAILTILIYTICIYTIGIACVTSI